MNATTRKRFIWTAVDLVLVAVVLTGCAAGVNPVLDTIPAGQEQPAGFWMGLWHGIIAPVTFLISLFTDTVNLYEVHNNGNWYDFGFILGLSCSLGGSAGGGVKASRR